MQLQVPPDMEQFVQQCVDSGRYITAGEVLRDGLALLQDREYLRERKLESLRKDIQAGIDQADRGETVSPDDARRRLETMYPELFGQA